MKNTKEELAAHLNLEQYPRSAQYDPQWMLDSWMGPNVLWLTEALSQVMELRPGMRVLDMGCGKAASSIFLAREFGLQVWATDLWLDASANWQRVQEAELEDRVFPIHAEAHSLPYADGFFDALISLDAYHYFGTDDLYIGQFARLVRPGGQIGIVVPGLVREFNDDVPEHLKPFWEEEWEFCSFHSPEWWRAHWEKSGKVEVVSADMLVDGWKHWLLWQQLCSEQGLGKDSMEIEMLKLDAGRNLGFTRILARRK